VQLVVPVTARGHCLSVVTGTARGHCPPQADSLMKVTNTGLTFVHLLLCFVHFLWCFVHFSEGFVHFLRGFVRLDIIWKF
jgi:hypothetical protein